MTTLLDYVTKAQDAQYNAFDKGSNYVIKAAEQASAMLNMAPKAPDAVAKAAKPFVTTFGTPADLFAYAKTSTDRFSAAVSTFQGRLVDVVNRSAVEEFAERSAKS